MSVFIRHARVLTLIHTTPSPGASASARARRGSALRELGILPKASVLVTEGKIVAVGPDLTPPADSEILEADGRVLLPGFVDCHTHACWAGDRLQDWEQELGGSSPAEIAKRGGGFNATVRAVREATRKQLAAALRLRLDQMLRSGTTTVEVKSGYGLTIEAELKMLHAIQRAAQDWPGSVVSTALLGQGIEGDPATHTRMVVREMLPAVWHEFPGITVDANAEEGGWPVEACVRLFDRALKHGLSIRAHTDHASSTGLIPEAVRLHARSVDHLEHATKADLLLLAASETFGVIAPATSFHTGGRYARGGAFVDSGGLIALATDYNPSTGPTFSLPFAIALAVRHCGLTVAEAINASTVNAAALLGFSDRGTIATGQRADLTLLRHRDERLLAHEVGANPVEWVMAGGQRV